MRKTILKLRDHNFFTNTCCECRLDHDDSDMVPVLVTRASGLVPREYFEPEYMCQDCAVKVPGNQLELENDI